MPTFDKIVSNLSTVMFNYKGDTIKVTYYPDKMSRKRITAAQKSNNEDPFLAEIIQSWNIYEDDAETVMFPVSRIDEFGLPFKEQLVNAIQEDMRPEARTPQTIESYAI